MRIKDDRGRIGEVTSETESYKCAGKPATSSGVFAKPEGIPYAIGDKDNLTSVPGAVLITATHWERQPDGSWRGLWFDSPNGDFRTAETIPDASTMGRKGGAVKSERKTTSSRENGRKGGRPKKQQ